MYKTSIIKDITFIKEQIDPKNNKKVEFTKNTENTVTPAHVTFSCPENKNFFYNFLSCLACDENRVIETYTLLLLYID
jgi:hypothetical protein